MITIGIIGRGSFGQFINTLIDQYAPHIQRKVYDPYKQSSWDSTLEQVCGCDIVFLAVPIRHFEQTLVTCKPLFSSQTIVLDVCTVKEYPLKCLKKHLTNQPYVSTHPMFGPYSYQKQGTLKDLRIVICEHTVGEEAYEQILSLARLLQLHIISCSAQEHDTMLAKSLFLTHYITQIVVGAGLQNTAIDTISFGNLMDVIESVRNDTALFHDVRTYNPYCKELIEQFSQSKKSIDKHLLSLKNIVK